MRPEPQLLCVYLKHWPIDRLRRKTPALRHEPFVLIDAAHPRQLITAVSPELPGIIQPGMPLAQARAFDAALRHAPADPGADALALEALARWLMRFSPNVALDRPDAISLDASGLDRLFGSLEQLLLQITTALARLGITAGVAVASTPRAAWALAAFGLDRQPEAPPRVSPFSNPRSAHTDLGRLPPEALRLDAALTHQLRTLGLTRLDLLIQLPREQLVSRFGPGLLSRLNQLLGVTPDPLQWLPHRTPIRTQIVFDGAVHALDALHLALRQLLDRIAHQLDRRGQGARELLLTARPPDGPPVQQRIAFTRPNRDPAAMFKTLVIATESLHADDGFVVLHLAVTATDPLGHSQTSMGNDDAQTAAALDHLLERLQARFAQAMEWPAPVESHVPEKAFAVTGKPTRSPNRKPVRGSQAVDQRPVFSGQLRLSGTSVSSPGVYAECLSRPIRLHSPPREIQVMTQPFGSTDGSPVSFNDAGRLHTIASMQGPERIEGQWWNNHWKTRDYFDVIDEVGGRHWIFLVLQNRRWFLHGSFE